MHSFFKLIFASVLVTSIFSPLAAPPVFADDQAGMIDDCRYADDAAAHKFWQPMSGTAPTAAATLDGRQALRLPCNFTGTTFERASWDRKVKLDLVPCQGVQFKVFCKNAAPISHYTITFRTGGGW